MNPRFFLKMAQIARRPPSKKMVLIWIVVATIALLLFAIERWVGWPDWLTVNSHRSGLGF
ncbi:MAG: hypothetical protein P8N80_03810 [Planktomarina sp.]|jgi:hypothetical protein|nr:hypothetical protein [Planktomarina sp.]